MFVCVCVLGVHSNDIILQQEKRRPFCCANHQTGFCSRDYGIAIFAYIFITYLSDCDVLLCVTIPVDVKQLNSTSLQVCYPLLLERRPNEVLKDFLTPSSGFVYVALPPFRGP